MPGYDYIRDPEAIYARSFALVREATDLSRVEETLQPLVIRIVHACAQPDVVGALQWSPRIETLAWQALCEHAPLYADCEMVVQGVIRRRLPADNSVICTLNNAGVPALAQQMQNTRSAAALEHWRERLQDAVVVFGNAPTALFYFLEQVAAGALPKPAAVVGLPVGFVGAAESKAALAEHAGALGLPFLTLIGRLGGSAMAAAVLNALARMVAAKAEAAA